MELTDRAPTNPARRRRAGMAMVEFVIILPVLLIILFGTIEMGVMLQRYQALNNAAREGARRAVLYRSTSCSAAAIQTQARNAVNTYVAAAGIAPSQVTVQVLQNGAGFCASDTATTPATTTVTATYTHPYFVLSGLFGMVGANFSPTITLTGSATMRNE
jgi:Flp pilus assembly protein TadG